MILLIIGIICYSIYISIYVNDKIYSNSIELPFRKLAVILGTAKYKTRSEKNFYFIYRINSAILLFQQKKFQYFILSGNRELNYNEPKIMEQELIKKGIPIFLIYKDYRGIRTLDSLMRIYKNVGQQNFTIVSQKFHNERAIFISNYIGLNPIGFNSKTPFLKNKKLYILYSFFREIFARIKVFSDIIIYL